VSRHTAERPPRGWALPSAQPGTFLADVLHGLAADVRKLPPKYFYDDAGARLFERITTLDEYYPTRTELGILEASAQEIAAAVGPRARVIELGSGSGIKTRLLLRELPQPVACIPIDIAGEQLERFAAELRHELPHIAVRPIVADYTQPLELPAATPDVDRTVVFFPGSTIGNFERIQAHAFLERIHRMAGPGGALILGTDMHKDADVLHAAYNDAHGVTAAFNLNLLTRMNRELGADFDLADFSHRAVYDEAQRRIEMRLVCVRDCVVRVPVPGGAAAVYRFAAGEYIITEYSHKYTTADVERLAAATGWQAERSWTDPREWFSVWLLVRE
jgi:L-histidine Nalpha-methyltransferase